jgi:murein L,D-transpeptidase YcbB/YkuD
MMATKTKARGKGQLMRGTVLISLILASSAGAAMAQVAAPVRPATPASPAAGSPTGQVAADPLAPQPGPATTAAVPAPAPVELPPAVWQPARAQELLAYVRTIGKEGLDPRDYDLPLLEVALRGGDVPTISRAATETWNKVVRDLALGHVRGAARVQWFVRDGDLPEGRTRELLDQALAGAGIVPTLEGLLPTHPQYGALRAALAMPGKDAATLGKIRLNMDRWRWLPRDLGNKYIIVNVPGEHATLVENSVTRWKHRAIAGAVNTPTPQLSVMATGVTLNPWWEVPQSLSHKVAGKPGMVAVRRKDGSILRWRQPPGPGNSLGRIKFTMANPHAIFLHDTNNRSLFGAQNRFLSAGCIRTENILDLAAELLADDGGTWTRAQMDEALKVTNKPTQADFVKPVPVYIVYFSVAALTDGSIHRYADLYKRDAPVLAALNDRDGGQKPPVRSAAVR